MNRKMRPCAKLLRRLRSDRRGAMAVEFALVMPVFLVMTIGIIEFGRAMYVKATLQHAVERTARYAMVNTSATGADLQTYAAGQVTGSAVSGATFSATIAAGSPDWATVTGTYTFQFMVPLLPIPDITLSAKSRVPLVN